jgi:hypothetical protein
MRTHSCRRPLRAAVLVAASATAALPLLAGCTGTRSSNIPNQSTPGPKLPNVSSPAQPSASNSPPDATG